MREKSANGLGKTVKFDYFCMTVRSTGKMREIQRFRRMDSACADRSGDLFNRGVVGDLINFIEYN